MTHETKPTAQNPASSGCCGGNAKNKAAVVAKPEAIPVSDKKRSDNKKAGGSCC